MAPVDMPALERSIDRMALQTGFSGVVRVEGAGVVELDRAFGLACRAWGVANTCATRFGVASATKGLTALVVMQLIAQGRLELSTPARSLLGDALRTVGADVTVEQLLAHRSGIGDYLDEDSGWQVDDHVLDVPVHELATTEQYLRVLEGYPARFPPGERFAYCNSGYVILALIAERVTATSFPALVQELVCAPAGMTATAFLRSDELPAATARGYLDVDGLRTNVLHLPVRGSGDGGIYSTLDDVHALWAALFAGRIVDAHVVADMVRARSEVPSEAMHYGLGFWLDGGAAILEGYDPGVSFRSVHDPATATTHTVIANTSEGAWPLARHLDETLPVTG
ncbi:MAG: beta-lactamase family protein [Nitriliruptoraceae bacterium]|nr:beta-lactamase family protein [Nitriliruptoraceae bacterium]